MLALYSKGLVLDYAGGKCELRQKNNAIVEIEIFKNRLK